MTDQFVFRLDQAESNLVGHALGKLPYDQVYMLIAKLQQQAAWQQTPPTPPTTPIKEWEAWQQTPPTPPTTPIKEWEAVMDGSQQEKPNAEGQPHPGKQEGRDGNGRQEAGQATDQEVLGHRHEAEGEGLQLSRRTNGEG